MSDEEGTVLVFRNHVGQPIAVPEDVVTAAERAYRCHRKRIQGLSWEQIAQQEGYPTAASAHSDVDRYIKEGRALVVEQSQREMLTLEVARLDAMQSALWERAMQGNVPSVNAVVNIIINRSRLIGLDANQMAETKPHTLVVPVDGDGFLAALKSAAIDTPTMKDQEKEKEDGSD